MNKYQESLNKIKCMGDKDLWNERHLEWADTLQELIDKYNELKSLLEEYDIDESNIRKMLMIANIYKEKATPKKVTEVEENDKVVGRIISYNCPKCEHGLFHKFPDINKVAKYKSNYCEVCGQALDWSREDD